MNESFLLSAIHSTPPKTTCVVPLGLCQNGCLLLDLFEDALSNLCEKVFPMARGEHIEIEKPLQIFIGKSGSFNCVFNANEN